ncbi:hypothetical protein [Streptacidiphilus rugosus]|uniref:hypothetical protein n=1 Tax=Streptacidiphilus rugosus TaxID=405783 RepID=UPI00056300EC|nr:hypothetical protein [Streptacidiphilus rugosus]
MPFTTPGTVRLAGACLTAACLALATPAGTAAADTDHPQRVDVVMKNSGFAFPHHLRAGWVTIRTSTRDAQGHSLQGFQLRKGHTLAQLLVDINKAISNTPATAAAGIRGVAKDALLVGGTAVEPSTAVSSTIPLRAGTYWFFDFNQVFAHQQVNFHEVQVHGDFEDAPLHFAAVVKQVETKNGPRFVAPDSFNTDNNVLVENHADEIHELSFQRVKPGVTDKDLTKVFNGTSTMNPFAENGSRGLAPMSPGRVQLLHFDPVGGRYAMLCFIPDDKLGIPHAFLGMHRIIRLR